ncbi:uncharacterized protein LOC132312397 isoform X2 [Cornus florida]|nr:uncharacterized protein LOC132312397 isoform X2 [Cornus florida]
MEINAGEDVAADNVEHDMEILSASLEVLQKPEDNDAKEIDVIGSGDSCKEDLKEHTSGLGNSDAQVIGDVSSGWKMVLHEESNRYYYWNTVTGETSWEVPDVLAQGTELTCEQKSVSNSEGRENAVVGTHESNSTSDIGLDDSLAAQTNDCSKPKEIYEHGPQTEVWNEGYKGDILEDKEGGSNINGSGEKNSSDYVLLHDVFPRQSADSFGNGITTADTKAHEEHETEADISSSLVKHGEYLLERLRSLKGPKGHLQGDDQIAKYILEVEIRLSDITSLLSYGSSLLPFWVHSERKLKQLEVIINDVVPQFFKSAQMTEAEETYNSHERMSINTKADGHEKEVVCCTYEQSHGSNVGIITEVQKYSHNEAPDYDTIDSERVSLIGYGTEHSGGSAGGKGEVHGAALPTELTPKTVLDAEEDVDMDVDMEVEDAILASNTETVEYCAPPEQPIQPNPSAEYESFMPEEELGVPPPPDDDWIPPPPPDNEPVPPPPPDEPPEPSYPEPPSFPETMPPLSYTEQYNLSYPGSNYEYYGQTTHNEIPGGNFYGHAEGCQVAVLHPTLYYEAVPGTYPGAPPVVVNPIEPVAYYDLQDGAVAPLPVVSGVGSSGFDGGSVKDTLSSEIRSMGVLTESGCISLPNTKVDASAFDKGTQKEFAEVPSTLATIEAPASISVIENVPVSSTPAVTANAVATALTVSKGQSKVPRSKKRTIAVVPSLRSNKKVSSLVDKWKAAKEELHEDEEDEPENAYEILEKKRQREIEEWRAKQIASGEAKDNANFLPLGGDWRERVKRRRAQSASKAVQAPSEDVTDGNKQPDLNELSRDLPSGWQAFWDESSKQVYYGNSITSETTWIKPTN